MCSWHSFDFGSEKNAAHQPIINPPLGQSTNNWLINESFVSLILASLYVMLEGDLRISFSQVE